MASVKLKGFLPVGWDNVNEGEAITKATEGVSGSSLSEITASTTQIFTESGTWTKPSRGTIAFVQVWSAGGGGARSNSAVNTAGGGGGGYAERFFPLQDLAATENITVGLGGTGRVSTRGSGTGGGASSFGTHIVVPGGGSGIDGGEQGGASGGVGGGYPNSAFWLGGNGSLSIGLSSIMGGGGGGGINQGSSGSGGSSVAGGAGGAGGYNSNASPGNAPAGGGGGAENGNGGNGARGEIRVTVF